MPRTCESRLAEHFSMVDRLDWLNQQLEALAQEGLERRATTRHGAQSASKIHLDGRELINFGSNDYLGLAAELGPAAKQAIDDYGWGSGASPLLGGRSAEHDRLETLLAQFLDVESALVFPTGFAANAGCITALVGQGDVVFSDALNHASIIDGCRLSKAEIAIYSHADTEDLESRLQGAATTGRRLIVTDTLFSMHGDVAPLTDLARLADKYGAMLMVDEAHATGVFGESGRGLCEQFGVFPDIHVGTLSKALGSHGGFVAGSAALIRWLFQRARPYFFSTASPPAVAAASSAAIEAIQAQPERRQQLLRMAEQLRAKLRTRGWRTGSSTSQITPIFVGDSGRAMQLSQRLLEGGVYAPGIRPPTVPEGESLLRISLSARHETADIDRLLELLGEPESDA